ncbi:HAMP domain-containing histidine kinase [Chitinophaga sedimenti]|uniref:sensor histidine kinase n=1 Tax=Chitinophaga sedimenti TaxID=2033606 RepID=UPI002005B85F|nr:HAMP domain-containing sensor histidine kinase [Chitinophaga sedimenti]MCK7558367.1 HAMP domain-containing histidine kinase [Chitinophaga sedimenti]
MKLRKKILRSFSFFFILILGLTLSSVYYVSSLNRQQEFYQRIKDLNMTVLKLLTTAERIDKSLIDNFDETTIYSLHDEKILLFDSTGKNIYTSIDDAKIPYARGLLRELRDKGRKEVTESEDEFDVVAHTIYYNGKKYFAIGKAYDRAGRESLRFLGWLLLIIFIISLALSFVATLFLSKQITAPITQLTRQVRRISAPNLAKVVVDDNTEEINSLTDGFNDMLSRVDEAFAYQKNFIQHVSHELKPIAVLMANIERGLHDEAPEVQRQRLEFQKEGLMQLAAMINTLIEISRYENATPQTFPGVAHIDELLFECTDELQVLYPHSRFEIDMGANIESTDDLEVPGNPRMLKLAFYNLLKNAVDYAADGAAQIRLSRQDGQLIVRIRNNGDTLTPAEQPFLFGYFFRGNNSRNRSGLGLGLVMVSRILHLHAADIRYSVDDGMNCFTLRLPH